MGNYETYLILSEIFNVWIFKIYFWYFKFMNKHVKPRMIILGKLIEIMKEGFNSFQKRDFKLDFWQARCEPW